MDVIKLSKRIKSAPLLTRLAILVVSLVLLTIPVVLFRENVICQESWSDDCWIWKDATPSSERDMQGLDMYQRPLGN